MKRKSILTVVGLLAVCAGCLNVIGIQSERQSKVALVKKLDGGDYGISKCSGLRLGDLDGDNIWIYRNSADSPNARIPKRRPQPKRLYNYTHYIGMP